VWIEGAEWNWERVGFALVGSWLAHAAANMLNDVADHHRGLDRVPSPVSGALARGWLSPAQTLALAILCLLLAAAVGAMLSWNYSTVPLQIAAMGALLAIGYTWLKPIGLGDVAVWLAFGPLISAGTASVLTGRFSWISVVWMIPFASLVVAVLHANNWRDIEDDRAAGVITLAQRLGEAGSRWYYRALIIGAYGLTLAMIILPRLIPGRVLPMPWTLTLVLLTWPVAQQRIRQAGLSREQRLDLDARTAQLMVPFGAASLLGLLLSRWL
jgi:1,4-dihydroxy-2-naphthoate octaprenyltransferase